MDELIRRLAAQAGIDDAVAEKAIGIILGLLRSEGPSGKVQASINRIPGTEAVIGLGMGQIQNVARELSRFGRGKIGADEIGGTILGTPGLRQVA